MQTLTDTLKNEFFIGVGLDDNTVELQRVEYLWNHENMFETGVAPANEYQ